MDILEEFKANCKGAWVNGKIVGAYGTVQGYVVAMTPGIDVEIFDTNKEASNWLKDRHASRMTEDGDTKH